MRSRQQSAAILCLVVFTALAACDSSPRPEPVVVYAPSAGEAYLPEWFAAFTRDTDIPVTVRYETSDTITANVIADVGSPPADVLLTNNIADIWRAADHGALRPIQSEKLKSIPTNLRDPDQFWFALDYRLALIIRGAQAIDDSNPQPKNYADLAEQPYRGTLCLTSSALPSNRSLIAMLIADLGQRPAELIVRGWIRNLVLPPYETELQLLAAVRSGTCAYGIVSDSTASDAKTMAQTIVPTAAYFDIDGVGVVRHARYPESAQRLVDWLLEEKAPKIAESASTNNIGSAGWHDEDAQLLAERAKYR